MSFFLTLHLCIVIWVSVKTDCHQLISSQHLGPVFVLRSWSDAQSVCLSVNTAVPIHVFVMLVNQRLLIIYIHVKIQLLCNAGNKKSIATIPSFDVLTRYKDRILYIYVHRRNYEFPKRFDNLLLLQLLIIITCLIFYNKIK